MQSLVCTKQFKKAMNQRKVLIIKYLMLEKRYPMVFKPMEENTYIAHLKLVGWKLSKAGIDYKPIPKWIRKLEFWQEGALNLKRRRRQKPTYEFIWV